MPYPMHNASAARRAAEERDIILRLYRSNATMEQLRDDLACRMGDRVQKAVERLQRTTGGRPRLVTGDGKPRALYWLTEAGRQRAEQLRAERRAA